jgi:hypothetical protein
VHFLQGSQHGANVVIMLNGDPASTITLMGVHVGSIQPWDFAFV